MDFSLNFPACQALCFRSRTWYMVGCSCLFSPMRKCEETFLEFDAKTL